MQHNSYAQCLQCKYAQQRERKAYTNFCSDSQGRVPSPISLPALRVQKCLCSLKIENNSKPNNWTIKVSRSARVFRSRAYCPYAASIRIQWTYVCWLVLFVTQNVPWTLITSYTRRMQCIVGQAWASSMARTTIAHTQFVYTRVPFRTSFFEESKLAWRFLNESAEEVNECSAADLRCRVMNVGISSRLG